jgi:hypothetical protein
MGQGKDEIEDSPAQLREAIAQARTDLGAHLSALGETPQPHIERANKMTTAHKKPKDEKEEASAKKKSPKKSSGARKVKSVAAKAGHVLDTMAAGAVVGAVKSAAQSIAQNESKRGLRKSSPSTGEVLGEIAPGMATGAVVGAAQAVMPESLKGDKPKEKKKVAKG